MITYLVGDATDPRVPGNKVVCHVCNDGGGWGRGFVLSLSKRWSQPEAAYRRWFKESNGEGGAVDWPPFELGNAVFVPVTPDIVVANMIAQHGTSHSHGPPIRYEALEECLLDVETWARESDHASVHMPRIGCGLAGGTWDVVEQIVQRTLQHTDVYVYDLPK